MINTNPMSISLKDLFDICVKVGTFRLFREEEDSKYKSLIICGVFRIRINLKTKKLTQQVFHYKMQGDGEWKTKLKSPCSIELFHKKAFFVNDFVNFSIMTTINSLLSAGYSIHGNMSLLDVDEFGRDVFYATIKSNPNKSRVFNGEVKSIVKNPFSLHLNKEEGVSHKYTLGWHGSSLKDSIVDSVSSRGWTFFGVKERNEAARKLSYKIWEFLDKEKCSQYFKSCFSAAIFNSNQQSTFEGYLYFSKRVTIKSDADFGGLWPFVGLLNKRKGNFYISGKTRELYDLLSLDGISYGDFKAMRMARPSVISFVLDMSYDKKLGISYDQADCRIAIKLLKHPQIKLYPVNVILWLFDEIRGRVQPEFEKSIYTICDKWLQYHQRMYRTIGFLSVKSRWRTEINYLSHVIDWLRQTRPEIHKNQSWASFWRLAEIWNRQLLENPELLDSHIPKEWAGTGINWDENVQELTSQVLLRSEGEVMEHCIASYRELCARGEYLAFSIKTEQERATLGVSRFDAEGAFRFDQIRGIRNSAVSRDLERMGRKMVERINANSGFLMEKA